MDDLHKLEADAREYGSPGDRERASEQERTSERLDDILAEQTEAVERVDPIGRPMAEDEERPVAEPEAAPHHDQRDVRPSERTIGRDVRSSSQNGQGVTR